NCGVPTHPVAESGWWYATFSVPLASTGGSTETGGQLMDRFTTSVSEQPALSVACTVNLRVPTAVGTPVRCPVSWSRFRPTGGTPVSTTANVTTPVPPGSENA